ncbi:MAG: BtpA/SgcQ family protein [Oscillospiraceae bacterium]
MNWAKQQFNTEKPIIAMCHIRALPGDPGYDAEKGMGWVVQKAREDLLALQEGGVDAVMFSNEFSLPYQKKVTPAATAAMARVIGQLAADIKIPFGVNMLWDPCASLDLASATGASFVREVMSGVYAGDLGLWDNDCGSISRHRRSLDAGGVRLLYNIYPESASYLVPRDIVEIARTTVFNAKPDALLVSGITAGAPTDTQILARVKEAAGDTYVFCNTGCREDNIARQLAVADGAIVGTAFKKDGLFDNFVDYSRVAAFMEKVHAVR